MEASDIGGIGQVLARGSRPRVRRLRSPELIEIVVLVISAALLVSSHILVGRTHRTSPFRFPDIIDLCLLLSGACLLGQTMLEKAAHRIALAAVHFLVLVLLLNSLEGRLPAIEAMVIFPLTIRICLMALPRGAAGLNTAVLLVAAAIAMLHGSPLADRLLALLLGGTFAFLGTTVVLYRERLVHATNALAFQSRSLENLAAANHSFVAHLESVEVESAERERLRITRELHDSIGYAMTNMAMMMNASRYLIRENPEKLVEYCRKTKELASSTLRDTRSILYKLRDIGRQSVPSLPVFFTKLCLDFAEATGVKTDCHTGNLPGRMDDGIFNTLFRAVQVGFINALKHGNTAHIELFFWLSEADLRMTIWNSMPAGIDDPSIMSEGIGLRGIRERLEGIGGSLELGPVVDGFRLVVTIPRKELGCGAD